MHIRESLTDTQQVEFLLDQSPDFAKFRDMPLSTYQRAIVFCDVNLRHSWWPRIEALLSPQLPLAHVEFLQPSEQTKDLHTYVQLVDLLARHRCTRHDVIIVIGGGTVLDAVAFLASTYMRGVPFVMIPTTLIGQADASTAGKTCINTEYAKNLLGTLYLPRYVYNNVTVLHTNPPYEMRQGFSEIFKYAMLGSTQLLALLLRYHTQPTDALLCEILQETIAVRLRIRRQHPLASNFGHTFGHALEKYSEYQVNHGDAIAVGMVMALEFSAERGVLPQATAMQIIGWMQDLGLNCGVEQGIDPDRLLTIMQTDKKSSSTDFHLVLIQDIAMPVRVDQQPFYPVPSADVMPFLRRFLQDARYARAGHWKWLKTHGAI